MELLKAAPHHQHFFFLQSPKVIPSLTQLNAASEEMTQMLLKVFTDTNALTLLKLWQWLHGQESTFGKIPVDSMHRVNFIYQESGKWFVLNMGQLYAWKKPSTPEEEIEQKKLAFRISNQIGGDQLAKRLLAMQIYLLEIRTQANKVQEVEEEPQTGEVIGDLPDDAELREEDEEQVVDSTDTPPSDPKKVKAEVEAVLAPTPQPQIDVDELDAQAFDDHVRAEDEHVAAKLEQLETIAQLQESVVETHRR